MSVTFDSLHRFLTGKHNRQIDKALWALTYQSIRMCLNPVHKVCTHERQSDATGIKALSIPGEITHSFTVMTHGRHGQQSRQDSWAFLLNLARYVVRGLFSFPFANITYACRVLSIIIINLKAVALVVLIFILY